MKTFTLIHLGTKIYKSTILVRRKAGVVTTDDELAAYLHQRWASIQLRNIFAAAETPV
jgi:hypothetical protein